MDNLGAETPLDVIGECSNAMAQLDALRSRMQLDVARAEEEMRQVKDDLVCRSVI